MTSRALVASLFDRIHAAGGDLALVDGGRWLIWLEAPAEPIRAQLEEEIRAYGPHVGWMLRPFRCFACNEPRCTLPGDVCSACQARRPPVRIIGYAAGAGRVHAVTHLGTHLCGRGRRRHENPIRAGMPPANAGEPHLPCQSCAAELRLRNLSLAPRRRIPREWWR